MVPCARLGPTTKPTPEPTIRLDCPSAPFVAHHCPAHRTALPQASRCSARVLLRCRARTPSCCPASRVALPCPRTVALPCPRTRVALLPARPARPATRAPSASCCPARLVRPAAPTPRAPCGPVRPARPNCPRVALAARPLPEPHTSGSLQAPTTPTGPAADPGEDVQWRYRADHIACTQWTECDAFAQLAVRAHLPIDQRAHFRQVQQLVEEASVGTCASTPSSGAASGGGSFGGGQQRHQRQPETLLPQQLWEWISHSHVPGGVEATSLSACEPARTGAAPGEVLHTFTLDSSASRWFFRNCNTVTPLTAPVPVTLADLSGGPVVACGSTVLPYPAAPSGLSESLSRNE
ncbi:unnamed protein product [Closterium sp. NIES-53]